MSIEDEADSREEEWRSAIEQGMRPTQAVMCQNCTAAAALDPSIDPCLQSNTPELRTFGGTESCTRCVTKELGGCDMDRRGKLERHFKNFRLRVQRASGNGER
jgi:hypothetical protein